jgi:predicted ATPase/class 3 adenylate cyclase
MTQLEFPSGIVTFLFTDLVDSTHLWEEYPAEMKTALARHDTILESVVNKGKGKIVKTTGDGLHAVFSSPTDAIAVVIAAQQALLSEDWGETGPLRVRMALHSGSADQRGGDYYGSVVNRAARIMGTASGEQILISEATAKLSDDQMPERVMFLDLGEHYLRGLNEPERLYQVLHPDLPAEFPPLKTMGSIPNNLPVETTSFIGRETELVELIPLLSPDNGSIRLITLIGPGGTGKTRLALQSARGVLDRYLHGVWFVELAPVVDPAQVIQAIATPMGVRDQGARPLELMVADHLRSQEVLIILDNCEHLIDECARLTESLLQTCPNLHILASSRESFGIGGEQPFRVRSLSLPPAEDNLSLDELSQYESIRLFVERASQVNPSFTLKSSNAHDISQICLRLDGIPLAIELAAARVRVLSPNQIAERLDDRFRLLTGGSRTALPRQRTLQALIDWSYDLLPEDERTLLCRLSVFINGLTLEAAETVIGIEPLESFQVLDLLEQLVNKSLVMTEETELGIRYSMQESIRQYAQEKLADSSEIKTMRNRHLTFFLKESLEAHKSLMDLQPPGDWGRRFKPEADNFRSAWAWSLEEDLEKAIRFTSSFSFGWSQVVPIVEVLRFLQKVLDLAEGHPLFANPEAPDENRILLGRAWISAATVASGARKLHLTIEYAKRSASIAEELGDQATLTFANTFIKMATGFSGGKKIIQSWLDEDYDLVMRFGKNYHKAICLAFWGSAQFLVTGEYTQESRERWEKGMEMLRRGGDLWTQGTLLQVAADLNLFRGKTVQAKRMAEQVQEIFMELGDKYAATPARSLLADLARQQGDLGEATRLYRETMISWRDSGRADAGVRTMESLAYIMHAEAQEEKSETRQTRLVYAAKLLGAADAIRQRINRPVNFVDKEEYARELAEIKAEAGESVFLSSWEEGQSLDLDSAALLAIEDPFLPSKT